MLLRELKNIIWIRWKASLLVATFLGPVPRSPISLIKSKLSCQFVYWIWDGFSTKTPALPCKLKTRWTALAFLRLNTCSLLDHKSRWRISLIRDWPIIGLWGTYPTLCFSGSLYLDSPILSFVFLLSIRLVDQYPHSVVSQRRDAHPSSRGQGKKTTSMIDLRAFSVKPGFLTIVPIVPIARQKVGRSGRSLWSEVFPYDRKDRPVARVAAIIRKCR